MENQNSKEPKFLGMKRDALMAAAAIFAPNLTILIVVVALFGVTNANISRLNDTVTDLVAQNATQNAAQNAAIEAIHSDVRDISDKVDTLREEVFELKTVFRMHSGPDSIERRLPGVDSADDMLADQPQ